MKFATALADRMKATNAAADVTALPGPAQPVLCIQLDRVKLKELGVSAADVSAAIRIAGGPVMSGDFTQLERDFTIWIDRWWRSQYSFSCTLPEYYLFAEHARCISHYDIVFLCCHFKCLIGL